MCLVLSIIIVFASIAIYVGSSFAVIDKWTKNDVPLI